MTQLRKLPTEYHSHAATADAARRRGALRQHGLVEVKVNAVVPVREERAEGEDEHDAAEI